MAMYPPVYNLIAAAVDAEQLGQSMILAILDSLITKEHGKVPSLMTLASKAIMESAIADAKKSSDMKECVEMSECSEFNPLIFGNCSATSQFIMENLPVHRIPSAFVAANTVQIIVHRRMTCIYISGRAIFETNYPTTEFTLQRIMQLSEVIFRRDFWLIGFFVDVEIPHVELIIGILKLMKEEAGSPLEGTALEFSDEARLRVCQFIDYERAEQRMN